MSKATSVVEPPLYVAAPVSDLCVEGDAHIRTIRFRAPAGLYQLSVVIDGSGFDFESLYRALPFEHSRGRRTGPWDFDVTDHNKPLVPTWRVTVDGRAVGMWYCDRISLADLEAGRFRGRMAMDLRHDGEHVLQLKSYQAEPLPWQAAWLEPDPDDTLAPLPLPLEPADGHVPVARWQQPGFWQHQRQRLATSHAAFAEPLQRIFDAAMAAKDGDHSVVPALVAAHYLADQSGALDKVLQIIDHAVDRPAWGNPDPDGYSHNGDMGAAATMLSLSWALHMLGSQLGESRRQRMLDKLRRHGELFVDGSLVTREYWGGSLRQDHGWNAMIDAATAALHLHGLIDEATHWLAYLLPRVQRALDSMPTDGVIPSSSYGSPWLYLERLAWYRDTLLALSGRDIFDGPQYLPIVDFVHSVLHEPTGELLSGTNGDAVPLIGGARFFSIMAAKHDDGRAAWIRQQQLAMEPTNFYSASQRIGYYRSALWDFFGPDAAVDPVPPTTEPRLVHFEDTGLAHWHDGRTAGALSVQCGPWCGFTAHRRATGSPDRMARHVGAGHFSFFVNGQPLLVSPDSGYAIRSLLCSVMLVDDHGQTGDIGYPMSIPSKRYDGEQIDQVRWDPDTATGSIRLDLTPAYPDELGVLHYTRQFLVGSEQQLICRDCVVLSQPRRLAWLFQGQRDAGVQLETATCIRFGQSPTLWIEPTAQGVSLTAAVEPTDVVYSYASSSGFAQFDHARFDSTEAVGQAMVDFVIRWSLD